MTIEIRELVIEAHIVANDANRGRNLQRGRSASSGLNPDDEARLIKNIVERVLETLDDRWERLK